MTIKTYTYSKERNRVNKTRYLQNEQTLTNGVKIEGMQNIKAPTLLIKSTTRPQFNYVYIESVGKYYFCETPIWISNKMWSVPLTIDPLYSNKDYIFSMEGLANRLEDEGHWNLLVDDKLIARESVRENVVDTLMDIPQGWKGFGIQTAGINHNVILYAYSGALDNTTSRIDVTVYDSSLNPVSVTYNPTTAMYEGSVSTESSLMFQIVATQGDVPFERAVLYTPVGDILSEYFPRTGTEDTIAIGTNYVISGRDNYYLLEVYKVDGSKVTQKYSISKAKGTQTIQLSDTNITFHYDANTQTFRESSINITATIDKNPSTYPTGVWSFVVADPTLVSASWTSSDPDSRVLSITPVAFNSSGTSIEVRVAMTPYYPTDYKTITINMVQI